jgi:flagellin-specific chaperone FliS
MNTSSQAVNLLQQAISLTGQASQTMDNLIVEHEYQDVAMLVTGAAAALLEAAAHLMQSHDEPAWEALERAEDLLDAVYEIIDAETDEE